MSNDNKKIMLNDGDGLAILPTSTGFMFGCCDCGLIHRIVIERDGDNIILKFHRIKKDDEE